MLKHGQKIFSDNLALGCQTAIQIEHQLTFEPKVENERKSSQVIISTHNYSYKPTHVTSTCGSVLAKAFNKKTRKELSNHYYLPLSLVTMTQRADCAVEFIYHDKLRLHQERYSFIGSVRLLH